MHYQVSDVSLHLGTGLAVVLDMGGVRLLVVDDEALVCWAIERAAVRQQAHVRIAPTGAEAIACIGESPYDVAFIDIHLPDINGLELLAQLRILSPATKFVVLTSDATPGNRERAYARGAWQFIEKPFDLSEVGLLLDECAHQREGRRAQAKAVPDSRTGGSPG